VSPGPYKGKEIVEGNFFPTKSVEGDEIYDNWSLMTDGIINSHLAYRNARLSLLTTHMGVKGDDKNVTVEKGVPPIEGAYDLVEAGDSISHDAFNEIYNPAAAYLSDKKTLFFEDGGLCAKSPIRVGTRVTTDIPAVALIARNLLVGELFLGTSMYIMSPIISYIWLYYFLQISIPPRPVTHQARFNGWNNDPRFKSIRSNPPTYDGKTYTSLQEEDFPNKRGERPVMAIVGGPGKHCAIQFSETSGVIVGCTVTCGAETPIRGLIAGLGHGACVMINEEQSEGVALPSVCVSKEGKTLLVIGADDSFVSSAVSSGILYGAYHNYLCEEGVSALWNGVIGPKAVLSENSMCPAVTVGKHAVYATVPDNMASPPTEICFVDKKDGPISVEDAVARYDINMFLYFAHSFYSFQAIFFFIHIHIHVNPPLQDR
jgi:hypothetical protein